MSPNIQTREKKFHVPDNVYTVILGLAFFIVLSSLALVTYKCYTQYNTIFGIPK